MDDSIFHPETTFYPPLEAALIGFVREKMHWLLFGQINFQTPGKWLRLATRRLATTIVISASELCGTLPVVRFLASLRYIFVSFHLFLFRIVYPLISILKI